MNQAVPSPAEALAIADALAHTLRATAAERDRRGGTAWDERAAIRASGLPHAAVPVAHGGWGLDWPTLFALLRRIVAADAALGHVLGFHYFGVVSAEFVGSPEQIEYAYTQTIAQGWFWGNAHNTPTVSPTDPGLVTHKKVVLTPGDGGYRLNGTNYYCSGSVGADVLIFCAVGPDSDRLRATTVTGFLPTQRAGVQINGDWDCIGQRQSDSGTVSFADVAVAEHEIYRQPGPYGDIFATLRTTLVHLCLANVYLGIAEGALQEGGAFVRERRAAYAGSGVASVTADPYVLRRSGELWVEWSAARAQHERAIALFQQAWEARHGLDTALRAATDIEVFASKVVSARAGLRIASEIFELGGTRATGTDLGLDRYWRNLRVHTLHDPLDFKLRDIGRWFLTGTAPATQPPP